MLVAAAATCVLNTKGQPNLSGHGGNGGADAGGGSSGGKGGTETTSETGGAGGTGGSTVTTSETGGTGGTGGSTITTSETGGAGGTGTTTTTTSTTSTSTLGPSCFNGTKDGTETDDDCGGGVCAPCGTGKHCNSSNDCVQVPPDGSVCENGACKPL